MTNSLTPVQHINLLSLKRADVTALATQEFGRHYSIHIHDGSIWFGRLGSADEHYAGDDVCPLKWLSEKLGKTITGIAEMSLESDGLMSYGDNDLLICMFE
jgi:hypothetical protein